MLEGLATRLVDARAAFGLNIHDPNLRRAQLSFGAAWAAEWAFTVALGVVAFEAGGASAVGIVGLLRMAPAALLAPFATSVADRIRRERILVWVGLVRAAATGAAAALLELEAPAATIYALAILATAAFTVYRPAHSALLPSLCRRPEELASANIVRGLLDSASTLAGPLIAAALLDFSTAAAVFTAAASLSLWSAVVMARVSYEPVPRERAAGPLRISRATVEGIRTIRGHSDVRLLIGLTLAQTFTRGALNVFSVVIAIEVLETGASGVGVLSAAVGAGAVLGSLGASLLVGSHALAQWFGAGVALWGLPIALVGVAPSEVTALVLLAIVGVGNALVDVGLFTLPPRLVPDEVLARVFGLLESLIALSVGLGSIVTPLVIALADTRGALVALGLVAPVLALFAWPRLRGLDETLEVHEREIRLLRRVPMLRPLPVPAIEHLARQLGAVTFQAGEVVFEQGDAGDRFYVIADGDADVLGDDRIIRTLHQGDAFGEIALLRDVPRTATVRAASDLRLWSLERERFIPAVTGYSPSAAEAHALVGSRLAAFTPRGIAI